MRRTAMILILTTFFSISISPLTLFSSDTAEAIAQENVVKVFYFHRKFRCPECEKTENLVKATLNSHFSRELASGRVTWQVVDLSVKENQHYLIDYDFMYNTVMIVESRSGKDLRFKNLEKIYEFGEDREGAMGFIKEEVENFLGNR